MATHEEPLRFYTDVYYDVLDDDQCLWTVYSFTQKELAEQFIEQVPFICSDVQCTKTPRGDDGHIKTHPYRPIFSTLEDALEDAKDFNKHGDDAEYKYHGRVFRVELSEIEKQHDKNLIKKLTKENNELKAKVLQLEAQHTS